MSSRVRGADLNKRRRHDVHNKSHRVSNDNRNLEDHEDALNLGESSIEDFPTPRWMTPEEVEVFEELRELVVSNNIAKRTDNYALRMLSIRFAEYIDLCKAVSKEGYLITTITNAGMEQVKANPLISPRDRAFRDSQSLLTEFGLTPSSRRTVLKADPEKADTSEEDEWDAVLN